MFDYCKSKVGYSVTVKLDSIARNRVRLNVTTFRFSVCSLNLIVQSLVTTELYRM